MCTYLTNFVHTQGSVKSALGWQSIDETVVYFDHPVHLHKEHSLNIDFRNSNLGVETRIGIELSRETAKELAETILKTLDQVPDL